MLLAVVTIGKLATYYDQALLPDTTIICSKCPGTTKYTLMFGSGNYY